MILRGRFFPERLPVYQFNYRPVFLFERLAVSGLSEPIENLPRVVMFADISDRREQDKTGPSEFNMTL